MSDTLSERHPVISDKTCPECVRDTVRLATQTPYVAYYACESCRHVWPEARPQVRSHDSLLSVGRVGV
jgi:hypothetical protein